ncbi:MAG: ABC transporter ATP-binding protein, partial [Clostridia bacterium]|nr:ABC transporter ATP-binding protein [Clostridia bacterium]
GPSGSGKTTLMNLMGCLDTPTSGTYLFDGENVAAAGESRLTEIRNKMIGFVFQSFYLLPKLTARENVALPLLYAGVSKKERLERAEELLEGLGLADRMDFLPNQLSGGQQQRVAIARAMAGRPRVLFADEPTGALDTASGEQIMELFSAIHKGGSAIVMITHEQSIADHAEKIYYIRDGILSE